MTKLTTIAKQILQEKGSDFWGKEPFGQDRNILSYFIDKFVEEKSKKKDLHKEMLEYTLLSPVFKADGPWEIEISIKSAIGLGWSTKINDFDSKVYTMNNSKKIRKVVFKDDYMDLDKIESIGELKAFKMKNGWSIWEIRVLLLKFFAWFDGEPYLQYGPVSLPRFKRKFKIKSEPNTDDENKLARALRKWYDKANSDSAREFIKYYDDILYAKEKFPKIFDPKGETTNVFRGTKLHYDIVDSLQKTKKTDWVGIKIDGKVYKKLKKPITYKPKRDAQSWTSSIKVARDFGNPEVILMTTISDNFFMTPDSSGEISQYDNEKEIIHITSDVKNPVYIIITTDLYKGIFEKQASKSSGTKK